MKKTTLNDIAHHLGVSKTLVSFVLNEKGKEFRISEEMRQKVKDAAREMNYQPNTVARGLRTGRTGIIGLIIADIANPFFGKLSREIEKEASLHGYRVIFCSSDEKAEKFNQEIAALQQSQVDGFIISPPVDSDAQILSLSKSNVPLILIDRYFPAIPANHVVIDNLEAARMATQHLLSLGRKRIANITINLGLINMWERTEGYKKALRDKGIEPDESLIKVLPFSHDNTDVRWAVTELIGNPARKKADAILFSSSKVGIMGIECIAGLGLKIPDDVAIISFDDADAFKVCASPVTVIDQPLEEIGQLSVQMLLNELASPRKKTQKPQMVKLPAKLIIRKSCGI